MDGAKSEERVSYHPPNAYVLKVETGSSQYGENEWLLKTDMSGSP